MPTPPTTQAPTAPPTPQPHLIYQPPPPQTPSQQLATLHVHNNYFGYLVHLYRQSYATFHKQLHKQDARLLRHKRQRQTMNRAVYKSKKGHLLYQRGGILERMKMKREAWGEVMEMLREVRKEVGTREVVRGWVWSLDDGGLLI